MIATLRGQVTALSPISKRGNFLVVEVSGVGYRVAVTSKLRGRLNVGETVALHTHLEVREDAHELLGFLEREELEMFELLLQVQRVGTRIALHVLDLATPRQIRQAVATADPGYLVRTASVGERMAEAIVAGLRGKVGDVPGLAKADPSDLTEAKDALVTLGFPEPAAAAALQQVRQDGMPSEEAVRAALKVLGKPNARQR